MSEVTKPSLEFTINVDDSGAFFSVRVAFVSEGSITGVQIAGVAERKAVRMWCSRMMRRWMSKIVPLFEYCHHRFLW